MADEWKQKVMEAVRLGDMGLLEELLENSNNKDLDFRVNGQSPLTSAIHVANYDVVEQLLCAGAGVDFRKNVFCYTPLMEATCQKNFDICQLLLKHDADVHATRTIGEVHINALNNAARVGDLEILKLLLEYVAHIFDQSLKFSEAFANSPTAAAMCLDHPHILSYFLEHIKENGAPFPLELLFPCSLMFVSEKCTVVLLKEGYYPMQDIPNKSHFQIAANEGMIEVMSLLIGINAYFMQEDWLTQEQLPDELEQHTDFVSWLRKYRKQAASLQSLCK